MLLTHVDINVSSQLMLRLIEHLACIYEGRGGSNPHSTEWEMGSGTTGLNAQLANVNKYLLTSIHVNSIENRKNERHVSRNN